MRRPECVVRASVLLLVELVLVLVVLRLVLLLHAEALAVPGEVDDARVRPEGHPGNGVAQDVHHHDRALKEEEYSNYGFIWQLFIYLLIVVLW